MGFHSIACIAAKGLAPAIGVKLMEIYGFSGPVITTVILALVAGLFVFLLRDFETTTEKSQSYRFIEVLLKKNVYLPTLVLFCGLVTFGAISAMLPVFAKERGISGIEYFFVINTVSVIIARLALGSWSNSYLESLVSTSLILLIVSFVSMSLVVNFHQLIAVSVIYGVGYALLFPMLSAILVLNVSPEYKGMALGNIYRRLRPGSGSRDGAGRPQPVRGFQIPVPYFIACPVSRIFSVQIRVPSSHQPDKKI